LSNIYFNATFRVILSLYVYLKHPAYEKDFHLVGACGFFMLPFDQLQEK
jgi:hypothetical protein